MPDLPAVDYSTDCMKRLCTCSPFKCAYGSCSLRLRSHPPLTEVTQSLTHSHVILASEGFMYGWIEMIEGQS